MDDFAKLEVSLKITHHHLKIADAHTLLHLTDLKRSFIQGGEKIAVLCGVEAQLKRGEIVALLGPSGSGKSTLLQTIGLLEGGFSGEIYFDQQAMSTLSSAEKTRLRCRQIGFVYQFHHLLADFSAIDNVIIPQLIAGIVHTKATTRAQQLLTELGLVARLNHKPSHLSGGEQQRVAVARALANQPLLVLADEPTGNLDKTTAAIVFAQCIKLVRDGGSSAIIATHNEELATQMDRIWRLHNGRIVEDNSVRVGGRMATGDEIITQDIG